MSLFTNFFPRVAGKLSPLFSGSVLALASVAAIGSYAVLDTNAHSGGITGQTQKTTNAGCYCHCSSAQSSTTVTLASSSGTSPLTTAPSTTYNFTLTVANSGEGSNAAGGCDISTYSGNGLTAGTGMYSSNGELTHSSPKSFSGNGYCTWSFTYTSSSTSGWDTIYATGNAVNGDGYDNGDCTDKWNWAPKFIIHNVTPPVRMALGRTSISLGQLRVGKRIADSLKVTSNGQNSITISSSGMKSGTYFSSYPTSTNRTINVGSTEMDSLIFTPTARGSFSDSLIFNTNSDTVPEQRMGANVTGQGIQAIFNSTNGTTLAFGNVRVNQNLQRTFSFSNSGDDTLFLQTPTISGSAFTIVSGPSTLTYPPNQSGSVVVKFAPTAQQSYSGSLNFTASNGVTAPSVSLSGAGTQPQIQISSQNNLGSIRVGQTLQGTVTFRNSGNDTLHVSNASLTQPSTRFTLGSYDQTILAGATGTVHISYTPNLEKYDTATLQFTSDDPSNTTVSVAVFGNGVLPHMAIAQKNDTVNLGQVKVNTVATANIGITNNGGADLNITSVSAGPVPFAVSNSPNLVNVGTSSNVTVSFSPHALGTFTGSLIVHGDDPNNVQDTVYLSGTGINSALSINPGSIDFGQTPVSTTLYDTITLSDSGKASVNIYGVQLLPTFGPFSIVGATPSSVPAGGTALIILSFKPDTAGNYSGSITLTTDDAGSPNRTVNLSGIGTKDPFTITPSPLDFGQVPILTTALDTLTLHNTGTASIAISHYQLTPASGAFVVVDSSAKQVPAGGTALVIFSFHPDTAGNYSASISLTSSDGASPNRTINLTGIGIKGSLTVTPSSAIFASVKLNADSMISLTLRNAGQAAVTINSVSMTGSAEFTHGTFTTPLTINPGNFSSISVIFTPTVAGAVSGSLNMVLADNSTVDVPLSGTGASPLGVANNEESIPFGITLSPNPASSAVVAHLSLTHESDGTLEVFDAAGRSVISLSLGMLSQGVHEISIPSESLSDGSYFVRISNAAGDVTEARLVIEKH